jgi:hypothetical protein
MALKAKRNVVRSRAAVALGTGREIPGRSPADGKSFLKGSLLD